MDEEKTSSFVSSPYMDAEIVKLRIDTEPILHKVEIFLKGEKDDYTEDPKTGKVILVTTKLALAKASPEGIQAIYSWLSGIMNSQISQGNFYVDEHGYSKKYEDFCMWIHLDFAKYLMNNLYEFGIPESEYEGIVDFVMTEVRAFLTRPIGDGERKGLSLQTSKEQSYKETERKRGLFS